ncbi:ornithine decarboxylase [Mycena filopes]|nr:ornithine decarboxylase [Mycena filopes]
MSRVQTIPASSRVRPGRWASSRHDENLILTTTELVENLSSSPTLRLTADQLPGANDDNIFPSLPPLLHGHPEVHLRNGVMNSSRLAANCDPDAEQAFFVADLSQVYRQHLRWQACLPQIQPFYAVKCNPDPYVLRLLAALGTGFDCASSGEISQILDLGVAPARIIFANPCKPVSFVRHAGRLGVHAMTFDNADELYKIARAHPDAQLVVRILTDDTKSLCALGIKFGAPLVTVPGLLAKAKELNLNVVGVSFHVGSGCYDPSVYTDAVMRARTAFDMAAGAGYQFTLLDVGGGFEDALFEQAATFLNDALATYFPDRRGLEIIAEPGRFYVSKAFSLAANIIARRAPLIEGPSLSPSGVEAPADSPAVMYYINDGVYGAFNCILFDHQTVHPYVLSMGGSFHVSNSETLSNCSVWGPTCDSIDCVCPSARLPSALRVGDWLAFDNMGAYTLCAASQFNGFELSKVIYTTGGLSGGFGALEVRRALAKFAAAGHGV